MCVIPRGNFSRQDQPKCNLHKNNLLLGLRVLVHEDLVVLRQHPGGFEELRLFIRPVLLDVM